MSKSATLYRLKLSLVKPYSPINQLHRILQITDNATFADLCYQIGCAFDRDEMPTYQFFISKEKQDDVDILENDCLVRVLSLDLMDNIKVATSYPSSIPLSKLALREKDYIYQAVDDAKNWLCRIRVEKILRVPVTPKDGGYLAEVTKSVGDFVPQVQIYTTDQSNALTKASQKQADLSHDKQSTIESRREFETSIISAMMLIATEPQSIRWQDLVDMGIADEMVKRGLIRPCINPSHLVRITPFGEHELVVFMEKVGMI